MSIKGWSAKDFELAGLRDDIRVLKRKKRMYEGMTGEYGVDGKDELVDIINDYSDRIKRLEAKI